MEDRILIVGGDLRQRELARLLARDRPADTLRVPGCPDTARPEPYPAVVLPCPAFDGEGRVRAEGGGLPAAALEPFLGPRTRIYGGGLGRGPSAFFDRAGRARDLLPDPFFAAANARLTAEAALAMTMEKTGRSLFREPCAVLGFGRIGRVLAELLRALGAEVTAAARRPEVLAGAESLGFRTAAFAEATARSAFVFNTVPAPVLTPEEAGKLPPQTLWIELASDPGGLPAGAKPSCAVLAAGSLPGRLLPRSAARLLYEAILRNWEE